MKTNKSLNHTEQAGVDAVLAVWQTEFGLRCKTIEAIDLKKIAMTLALGLIKIYEQHGTPYTKRQIARMFGRSRYMFYNQQEK